MYLHIDTNVDMWILIRGMQNYFPKSWHMTYNEFGIPLVNTPGQCPESLYDGFFVSSCEELMWLVTHYKENIRTLESVTTSPLGIFHIWPVATFNLFTTFFVASALGLYVIASQGSFFLVNVATVALFWYDKHQAPCFFQNPQAKRRERRISWTHLSKRLEGGKSCLVLLYFFCQSEFSENAFHASCFSLGLFVCFLYLFCIRLLVILTTVHIS